MLDLRHGNSVAKTQVRAAHDQADIKPRIGHKVMGEPIRRAVVGPAIVMYARRIVISFLMPKSMAFLAGSSQLPQEHERLGRGKPARRTMHAGECAIASSLRGKGNGPISRASNAHDLNLPFKVRSNIDVDIRAERG